MQVGRVEEVLRQLVDRETAKPGPSTSRPSSSAYLHAFSKLPMPEWIQQGVHVVPVKPQA